jgi:hypothetical protein
MSLMIDRANIREVPTSSANSRSSCVRRRLGGHLETPVHLQCHLPRSASGGSTASTLRSDGGGFDLMGSDLTVLRMTSEQAADSS